MLKQLSADLQAEGVRVAVQENPCNRPPVERIIDLLPVVMTAMVSVPTAEVPTMGEMSAVPGLLAVLTSKYWGSKGVDLTVGFMESTPTDLRERILSHFNAWGEFGNVRFRWTQTSPQVRITREADGYWSYLGTDILSIPNNQPTMSLQAFTMRTSEKEYRRVVRHEAGHTLGFPHEHMRKAIVDRLDPAKTIAWGARVLGWSAATVRQQILTPLEERSLLGLDRIYTPDIESIMCYSLPASITKDGQSIPGGDDFDEEDKVIVSKIYPKGTAPPPPPPPPIEEKKLTKEQLKAYLETAVKVLNAISRLPFVGSWAGWAAGFLSMIAESDIILTIIISLLGNQLTLPPSEVPTEDQLKTFTDAALEAAPKPE